MFNHAERDVVGGPRLEGVKSCDRATCQIARTDQSLSLRMDVALCTNFTETDDFGYM